MPLTFVTPPVDGMPTLQLGLERGRQAQSFDARGGAALAVAPTTQVMQPHPVYELGLDDLAAGGGLDTARLVAWRYLLVENNQARQAAEILPGVGGSRFGMLTTGFVPGAEAAFGLAERLPEVQQGDFEIRALRVPALYVMSLWLKDKAQQHDRFIVLPPAFAPLQSLRPYTATDLLTLLRGMAAHKAPLERNLAPSKP